MWGLLIAILLFVVIPLVVLFNTIDSYPLVVKTEHVDIDSAIKAKNIALQLRRELNDSVYSEQRSKLTLSENEINGIIALGMRGIKRLKGRVNVTQYGIKGAFTFKLPSTPFGSYVNLTTTIIPSDNGLDIQEISIGNIALSGDLAISMAEFMMNRFLSGNATGTRLVKSIESVTVSNSQLNVSYHVIHDLRHIVDDAKGRVKHVRDELALLSDPIVVKLYYLRLCDYHGQIAARSENKISLGRYLSVTYSFAEKRSLTGKNPVDENKAGLLALAIFLGSTNFNSVVGAVDKETQLRCQPYGKKIVLANRTDLRLHFIYSAALKVITDSGVSFAIGEFKEMLDSQAGGSGFSFADLAADLSGIRFAELALNSKGAVYLQKQAAILNQQETFFPSIESLPERISQHSFESLGGIESKYYKKHLAIINARLDALHLYKPGK